MATAPAVRHTDSGRSARTQFVTLQVLAVTPAARDTITLSLALPGTRRSPGTYLPGQFITLAFPGNNTTYYRSYSLCGDGQSDQPWEITVKRQNAGIVSSYVYSHVRPGMVLQASMPQGRFTLPATLAPGQALVFVAAGSGITPIYSMLRAIKRLPAKRRARVFLHYAYHNAADAIYGAELAALDPEHRWLTQWHYVTTNGHRLGVEQVLASVGAKAKAAEWYVCGTASLKRSLESALPRHGIPAGHIHSEVFASPTSARTTADSGTQAPGRIRLVESGAALETRPGETLLESLERYGYRPDFNCRSGACGTCRLRLLSGRVQNGYGSGLTPEERAAGYVLSCVASPVGEIALAGAGQRVAGYSDTSDNRVAFRRANTRRRLRLGLVAATVGLFVTAWGFTNHSPTNQADASPANSTSPSSPGFFSNPASGSNNGSSGQSTPGSIFGQPGLGGPSTSTGVS